MTSQMTMLSARIPVALMHGMEHLLTQTRGRRRTSKATMTTLVIQALRGLLAQCEREYRRSVARQTAGFQPAPLADADLMDIVDEEDE